MLLLLYIPTIHYLSLHIVSTEYHIPLYLNFNIFFNEKQIKHKNKKKRDKDLFIFFYYLFGGNHV